MTLGELESLQLGRPCLLGPSGVLQSVSCGVACWSKHNSRHEPPLGLTRRSTASCGCFAHFVGQCFGHPLAVVLATRSKPRCCSMAQALPGPSQGLLPGLDFHINSRKLARSPHRAGRGHPRQSHGRGRIVASHHHQFVVVARDQEPSRA